VDTINEKLQQLFGRLEEKVAVFDGDVVDHVPRILKQCQQLFLLRISETRKLYTLSKVLMRHSNGRWGQSFENGDCFC
jgi:hypothetical protein